MKVLLANKFLFNNGGAEAVLLQERMFLTSSGADVIDFAMQHERNIESRYANHFVSRQEYRTGGHLAKIKSALALIHSREAVSKLASLIEETRPDLMHCHNIYHQLTPSIVGVAKSRGIPVVLTLHDSKPVCPVHTRMREDQLCSSCLAGDFHHVLMHRCADGSFAQSATLYMEAVIQRWFGSYEKVDRFLAPSQFMRESVLPRFAADRVQVLYNGVDVTGISASDRDKGYVLYCGRLAPGKGAETLLRAHEAADCRWPLVIAGSGPLADNLKAQFTRNVRFAGQLSGETLNETIAEASVVVVPSEWCENCPMSVLEAMAYGKAVIATRVGGIPELVDDRVTGLLFEPGNTDELRRHLDCLMSDAARRAGMGAAGRSRVEADFSLEKHNTELMAVYRSLVSERHSSH
ncbi:glycosyltransferase family 4 protein [Bradyrhizobium elkanii]|jgi:glycosyltransferase involved in cell wall biosynthesis|uniref:glycosyltransferase family 4 protein n=1 Tax=Bradyrhizobium elkanii TaxID=29448 RepID=UPI0020A04014|nr:glycosyltransferase family 4 protein [Bradyrhizobium elkanii]MCP1973877.1 glycosyltransferase involved in cell wall biosynthesis [Bradyrhizobium elkanii]MCS3520940.1 glycosyltransferase involved in cell wall biosynthesis [Bradyrhizobium elkanii]MCS4068597.1 glycosyltransferase involved in cell wall biosynthesis [Bradyrhizobium elkanii]MCS4084131.1 glycosyltransferase involved in cell wall biosynthesis [Bradyrhizobium elkanii]MCS4104618.1 glycosyltransferase involved in cell wall biosynthesi